MMARFNFTIVVVILFGLLGCVGRYTLTPHENFKLFLFDQIGRKLDDVPHSKNSLIKIVDLQNGNKEYWYNGGKGCSYIFEVNSETQIIITARFIGTKETCVIVP